MYHSVGPTIQWDRENFITVDHVRTYGSGHTEAIVTADGAHADRFRREVVSVTVRREF